MSNQFTGASFVLQSVTALGAITLRVRFTQDPIASNSSGSNDALNTELYTLTGPGSYAFIDSAPVSGDPQAVDLFLADPLAIGVWSLTASLSIKTTDTSNLTAPNVVSFTVAAGSLLEGVAKGAVSDTTEDILRKHFNPALKGKAWDALIAAIATGDTTNQENAKSAFDQLFISTASGIYLTRRAADEGVQKPFNIGMSDDLFRQFSIRSTNAKLTEESLLEILEVFYGVDSVRAFVDSGLSETYVMNDGDELIVLLDEQDEVTILFEAEDFAIISLAEADEIAAAITRAFRFHNLTAYAVPSVDAQTGDTNVRIYSGSRGLNSSVRVLGGKAQNALRFPTLLDTTPSSLPVWDLTFDPTAATVRFSPDGNFDVSLVRIGDYVTVYGDVFNDDNKGTFEITDVYWAYPDGITLVQWFEVVNASGVNQASVVQLQTDDLRAFRPTRHTIHTTPERSVVVSSLVNEVDLVLPATSQAVARGAHTAAYGQIADSVLISETTLERVHGGLVTVDTVDPHGLVEGGQVLVQGVYGAPIVPPTSPGSTGLSQYSKASIWSDLDSAPVTNNYHACACLLGNGKALLAGGDTGPNNYIFDTLGDVKVKYETDVETTYVGTDTYNTSGVSAAIPHLTTWTQTVDAGDYVLVINPRGIKTSALGGGSLNVYVDGSLVNTGDLGYFASNTGYDYSPIYVSMTLSGGSHLFQLNWTPGFDESFSNTTLSFDSLYDGAHGYGSIAYQLLTLPLVYNYDTTTASGVGTHTDYLTAAWTDVTELAAWNAFCPAGDNLLICRIFGFHSSSATGRFRLTMDGTPVTGEDGWVVMKADLGGSTTLHLPIVGDDNVHTFQVQYYADNGTMRLSTASVGGRTFHQYQDAGDFLTDSQAVAGTGTTTYSSSTWTTISDYPDWVMPAQDENKYTLAVKLTGLVSSGGYARLRVLMDGAQVGAVHHVSTTGGQAANPYLYVPVRITDASAHTFSVQIAVDSGSFSVSGTIASQLLGSRVYHLFKPFDTVTRQVQATTSDTVETFAVTDFEDVGAGEFQATYQATAGTSLPSARSFATMTAGNQFSKTLQGRALFAGGSGDGVTTSDNAYAYDHDLDSWTSLAVLNTARMGHAQTTLTNGKFLVTGGTTAGIEASALTSCEIYDVTTDTWTPVSDMNEARADHEQILLPNGKVLVIGGRTLASGDYLHETLDEVGPVLATCEIYDPDTDIWTKTGRMSIARIQHKAIALPDGRVLVVGGIGFNPTQPADIPTALRDAELWNPTTGAWQPAGRTAFERDTPVVAYLSSKNQVIVAGGSATTRTELFDPVKVKWSFTSAELASLRYGAKAVLMANDLVFLGGGLDGETLDPDDILNLYIPNSDRFLGGGLNGIFRVSSVTSPTTFTFETPNETQYTLNASDTAEIVPMAAPSNPGLGPYIFNPHEGVAVTGIETTTMTVLAIHKQYASIDVDDATEFPDEPGWLVFGFGYEYQAAPVRYLGRLSETTLALDFKFKFPATVPAGAKVTLLAHKGPFVPEHPEDVGSFYITDSPAGRVAAANAVEAATGAGIPVSKTITYPGDRGLGGEGLPSHGNYKLSDKVSVWAGSDVDAEVDAARKE